MTKVSRLTACPNCNTSLSGENLCIQCGWMKPSAATSELFEDPAYVSFQLKNHQVQISLEKKDILTQQDKLEEAHDEYFRNIGAHERNFALDDAYESIRTLQFSKVPPREMKQLLEKGKRLGRLSEHLDGFYKNGGKYNVRTKVGPVPTKPGDDPWSSETID